MLPPGRLAVTTLNSPQNLHQMSDKIRIPDSIDLQRLQAMQLVAKMKESADKHGVGFIGGFISPDGQKFIMTNLDDEDSQALLPDNLK